MTDPQSGAWHVYRGHFFEAVGASHMLGHKVPVVAGKVDGAAVERLVVEGAEAETVVGGVGSAGGAPANSAASRARSVLSSMASQPQTRKRRS